LHEREEETHSTLEEAILNAKRRLSKREKRKFRENEKNDRMNGQVCRDTTMEMVLEEKTRRT
jgi:hypothetical protein